MRSCRRRVCFRDIGKRRKVKSLAWSTTRRSRACRGNSLRCFASNASATLDVVALKRGRLLLNAGPLCRLRNTSDRTCASAPPTPISNSFEERRETFGARQIWPDSIYSASSRTLYSLITFSPIYPMSYFLGNLLIFL